MAEKNLKFIPYAKMNTKGKKTKKLISNWPSTLWVVLEKVHGCNFSFVCDGVNLSCARRTSLLQEQETFYGWQTVRDKLKDNIFKLFQDIKNYLEINSKGTLGFITIFGELFGGIYPHPEVKDLELFEPN
eukprot:TRINITY_DN11052_c0_g1_i2.p1 TRINITY_DN11052_c0_g1~~TRINITY_DN11052_c0_g1_i2.p1  ORF type:complete len:130 (-),score=24.33 TRINITY_DN11052_c0_g1_i2:30-419(-)